MKVSLDQDMVNGHCALADLFSHIGSHGKAHVQSIELPASTRHLWAVLIGDSNQLWGAKVSWVDTNIVTLVSNTGSTLVQPWGRKWNLPLKGKQIA